MGVTVIFRSGARQYQALKNTQTYKRGHNHPDPQVNKEMTTGTSIALKAAIRICQLRNHHSLSVLSLSAYFFIHTYTHSPYHSVIRVTVCVFINIVSLNSFLKTVIP